VTCALGLSVGLGFFHQTHQIPVWRRDWLPTDVYFENCITKPCQVGHRPWMLSSDYNVLRSTVIAMISFIQCSQPATAKYNHFD